MPAYVIVETVNSDDSYVEAYRPKTMELIAKHGGKYLARAAPTARLEGKRELPDLVLIFEFPSEAHAQAWYDDPEYQPLIKLRQTGARSEMTLVDGL